MRNNRGSLTAFRDDNSFLPISYQSCFRFGGRLPAARRNYLAIHPVKCTAEVGRFHVVPFAAKVGPGRIDGFDERDLFRASPAFEFLFAGNRSLHVLVALEPDEAIAIVARGEPLVLPPFVLEYTFEQIARYSDVNRMAATGHNVRAIGSLMHGPIMDRSGRM